MAMGGVMPNKKIVALSALLALVSVACGGGESGADSTTTPTTDAPSTTTTTMAEATTSTEMSADAPELAGTSWTITHHASEIYGGVTNVWDGTEITLEFGADGTFSGNAGCNDYEGAYGVSGPYVTERGFDDNLGQAMTITDLSFTEMACDDENLMEQETEYLAALQNVEQWVIGTGFGGDEDLLLTSLEDGLQVEGAPAA
jgi:heat shock protein HslJ